MCHHEATDGKAGTVAGAIEADRKRAEQERDAAIASASARPRLDRRSSTTQTGDG